ncbi:hypothetical protein [Mesorhizobium caraganae]|uniref:hypothetical protein n=1 Tax=Mesorhizobium caraganae TaxID=483206 RepID=UPI001FE5AF00|nr:hypothetical protein [Mesorhizobium caraganae]
MILTVADMNRLEQAARISMSGFQDPDASASPAHTWHPLLRFAAVALVAAIVLIVASQLG